MCFGADDGAVRELEGLGMQTSRGLHCGGRKSAKFWSILLHAWKYYASLGASMGIDERTTRYCTPVLLPVRVYVRTRCHLAVPGERMFPQ